MKMRIEIELDDEGYKAKYGAEFTPEQQIAMTSEMVTEMYWDWHKIGALKFSITKS